MNSFDRDLRLALRSLLRSPGFTAMAVLTLALGIGASTAIYALLERVVLDPLPYPEAGRLVQLKSQVPGVAPGEEWDLASAEYFHFGDQARTIEGIGAYRQDGANIMTPAGSRRARVAAVTAGTLRLLGAQPALGRVIDSRDDQPGAAPVAVLSHGFWQQQFGGDPQVIGRTIDVNGQQGQVIGVMEPGLDLPGTLTTFQTDLWIPMQLNPEGPFQNAHGLSMIARLGPGVTLEQAQAEMDRLTAQLPELYPSVYWEGFFEQYGFRTKLHSLKDYVVGDVARNLWILLGAVGLVLLIACANVTNLFLVRVEGRRRELAIRSAMGAGRAVIARHLLAESLALALAGGGLALILGFWGVDWLVSLAPASIPRLQDLRLDGSIVLFTLVLSLIVALALAAFPVLRHSQASAIGMLSEGGRGGTAGRDRHRVRSALVVTQVALALILIVGAGLLVESFRRLNAIDPGIEPEGVLTLQLYLTGPQYDDEAAMWRFYDQVLGGVRALPGVTAAGMSHQLPLTGGFGCWIQGFEDPAVFDRLSSSDLTTCAGPQPTSPGYFEAMGIPLLQGRTFTEADNDQPTRGAVVVSRAFADRFWPGEDAIGKGVRQNGGSEPPFHHVVGVVGDVYASSLTEEPALAIYYPIVGIPGMGGRSPAEMSLAVRTELANPASLLPAIRRVVQEVDPAVPVANVAEMQTIVDRSMSRISFTMTLLGISAMVALLLAAIGLYGVISYIVVRRTSEIGVRMALGAQPRQVEHLVIGSSLKLVVVGLGIGLLAAFGLTRLLRSLLYGVDATHPTAYAAAALLLAAVALLAAYLPARRAARVDPMVALRAE